MVTAFILNLSTDSLSDLEKKCNIKIGGVMMHRSGSIYTDSANDDPETSIRVTAIVKICRYFEIPMACLCWTHIASYRDRRINNHISCEEEESFTRHSETGFSLEQNKTRRLDSTVRCQPVPLNVLSSRSIAT